MSLSLTSCYVENQSRTPKKRRGAYVEQQKRDSRPQVSQDRERNITQEENPPIEGFSIPVRPVEATSELVITTNPEFTELIVFIKDAGEMEVPCGFFRTHRSGRKFF